MRRLSVIAAVLVSALGFASGPALASADSSQAPAAATAKSHHPRAFVGYWMGTDPRDGGDSRRGFTLNPDGTVSMAGRDSYVGLCGGGDLAYFSFSDGVVAGSRMTTDHFVVTCFNNGEVVTLHARYDLIGPGLMRETLTREDGTLESKIVFHRVSAKF